MKTTLENKDVWGSHKNVWSPPKMSYSGRVSRFAVFFALAIDFKLKYSAELFC